MTAASRRRKFEKKRNKTNDDPYTLRLRKASEGAARARDEARSRAASKEEDREVLEVRKAKLLGASLVKQDGVAPGFVSLQAAISRYPDEFFEQAPEVFDELAYDVIAAGEEGLAFKREAVNFTVYPGQEALRAEAASDAAPGDERGPEEPPTEPHTHYFEKEVDTVPHYSHKSECLCDIREDHWTTLGEN